MRQWRSIVALGMLPALLGVATAASADDPVVRAQRVSALSASQFEDVTDRSFPAVEKASELGTWIEWEDRDGDGLVDRRPSYGMAVGDANGDGFVDLWLNNHFGDRFGPPPSLWLNQGDGTFADGIDMVEPFLDGSIASGDRHGSIFADFDNDGDQDLLVLVGLATNTEPSRNKLYINDEGTFVDRGIELGIADAEARAREAVVFDMNNDGLLDFVMGANADGTKEGERPPTVYQQNDDGTFTDVGAAVGFEFNRSYGLEHGVLADLDGDGIMELIQKQPFRVLKVVSGAFVDITASVFTGTMPENDRGLTDIAVADFNGDLVPDFFMPSSAVNAHQLVLSSPDGWRDVSETSGVRSVEFLTTDGGGVAAGDFDNDGDIDMLVLDRLIDESDYLLENDGTGTFEPISFPVTARPADLERPDLRSVAVLDFNNDGALDLLETTNSSDPTYRLLENSGNGNHWLSVVVEGVESNRDGIGAIVQVTTGDRTQVRQQIAGIHHRVQDDQRLHFGVADATMVDEIRVVWPSGIEQVFSDVSADGEVVINEVSGIVEIDVPLEQGAEPADRATEGSDGDDAALDREREPSDPEELDDEGVSTLVIFLVVGLALLVAVGAVVYSRRPRRRW